MFLTTTLVLNILLAVASNAELPSLGFHFPSNNSPRLVGGKNAVPGQFPYQVSLQWGLPPIVPHEHFCGGTILNNKWILTAGHCIKAIPPNLGSFIVKVGKYNISRYESSEQEIKVKRTFVHQNYTGGVAPYDIALILLAKPLIFNKYVSNVSLPMSNEIHSGNSILSGWGSVSNTSLPKMPHILQYVSVPLITLARCKIALESIVGRSPLHNTNLCTGPLTGGFAACNGDSGGPLVVNKINKREIIGVVSWGIVPCGSLGAPSVYTRTSAFVDWIKTTMRYAY